MAALPGMALRFTKSASETQKKRSYVRRMMILHGFLLVCLLLVIARLIDLQIIQQDYYFGKAQAQHYGSIKLPARRGEILAVNDKSGETSILATNTTLDLVYVDPLIVDDPTFIAETLADLLVTEEVHALCAKADPSCPKELTDFYDGLYDPLSIIKRSLSGTFLEPVPLGLPSPATQNIPVPDMTEIRRRFARDIEDRISEKRLTFAPLKYGATKKEMDEVAKLEVPGITVDARQSLIYANPEEIIQGRITSIARSLAPILKEEAAVFESALRSRPLRYVAIMRRLEPEITLKLKELKLQSMKETSRKRAEIQKRGGKEEVTDPLRSVALIPENWRYYPDATIASQIVGFVNNNQDAQYGAERTFDPQLRGQEGSISTVNDPQGGQIVTTEQTIVDPKDGDTVVLTIDPVIQKRVEAIIDEAVKSYEADSGQVIVMNPENGRIVAMANAPIFDRNRYADVYAKEPLQLTPDQEKGIVVELYDPETNGRVVKDYIDGIFTPAGRGLLSEKIRQELDRLEALYDLRDLARYFIYKGETIRIEVFPTELPGVWLKYRNNIGVGAYLNRAIQEIYEPGSVMKPVTMAIALDQGEVTPADTYLDTGMVEKDEYKIYNNDKDVFGNVHMTNCLEYSINTCMTDVADRLGKKLFQHMLGRFGYGRITGIELEDEVSGELTPWRTWSDVQLATTSFGQGIAATPLQVISSYLPLANGGKLVKPTIVDRIIHTDGTVDYTEPKIIDQVITAETSETITSMLVSSMERGFAKAGRVPGYKLAGKTGTSQIAGPGGRYETGTGSTIASFTGYGPVGAPRFVILVKIDRPKFRNVIHGATAAAPVFRNVAKFLFEYYGIPPS